MRNSDVEVCVLKTDGINCDEETNHAFAVAGAHAHTVHINSFRSGYNRFGNFDILVIPGGFSHGDDIASGKVLGNELTRYFREELQAFTQNPRKLVLGICNGFQVLVRAALLPYTTLGAMQATLSWNTVGHFRNKWIKLRVEESPCAFMRTLAVGEVFELPVANGEGNFWTTAEVLAEMKKKKLIPLRYAEGTNPSGSLYDIAGVCNEAGNVFGLMPHPERFVRKTDHPNWRRLSRVEPLGLALFKSGVEYVRQN